MRTTRALERRLDRVQAALDRRDVDVIFEVGFRLIVQPPAEGYPPLRVSRAVIERIAGRRPESPFEAVVVHWARQRTGEEVP